MYKQLLLFFFLLSTTILFSCNNTNEPSTLNENSTGYIAIINGTLIDGTGNSPITNAVILENDSLIAQVGKEEEIVIPLQATILDIDGAYILPGFLNTHVHSGYDKNNLKEWAKQGVTTVRDLGNFSDEPSVAFSNRNVLLKENNNARLVAVGPMVTTIGGYGGYYVKSPSDASNKIISLIDEGADLIKIAIEDNLQGRTWPMLSQVEINTIVETAHSLNKPVVAHISTSKHLAMAVEAGVDEVTHMIVDHLPDSLITLMVNKDIYYSPTLELWDGVSKRHNLNWDNIAINNLSSFFRAGGKVAIGTDFDGYVTDFQLGMPILEMQLMKEAGMSNMEIIVAGTKHAAYVCNLDEQLGTIEGGKIADIIIVKNNPLDDLQNLVDVKIVFHNGQIIKNSN